MMFRYNHDAFCHKSSIERFADQHGLVMHVRFNSAPGYAASFDRCEVARGSGLLSEYGIGATKAEAINNYAKLISGKRILFCASEPKLRAEFDVPVLHPDYL